MSVVPGKILIVDDFKTNIVFLKQLLENEGHEVHSGQNAEQAMETIIKSEFDLILLDIVMPKTDGFKVCEMIRTSDLNSNTPVIFLTSKNDEQSVLHGFDIGAQDYIVRPFHEKELLARVNTHIELKIRRAALEKLNKDLENLVSIRTEKLRNALKRLHISYHELNHAKRELESLDNAKENFLRMINHEIRTPLNGILGFNELLKDICTDDTFAEYLNMMHESVKRLERFSMQALFITQLKTGKYDLEKTEIDIASQIENCVHELKTFVEEKNLAIHFDIEKALLNGDLQLFQYSLHTLLENAIKQSSHFGEIEIKGKKNEDQDYYLCISHTGKEFSESVLKNANSLFSDNDFIDENPGLAMYTIGLILNNLNGNLLINNNPDGGSTVQMIFSLNPSHSDSGYRGKSDNLLLTTSDYLLENI
jgi:two-component system, sensor histidine kinase and response regulator